MLNSTLRATGLGVCCLLEKCQTEDGVRFPPELLQPSMTGIDFLPFTRGPFEMTKGEETGNRRIRNEQ